MAIQFYGLDITKWDKRITKRGSFFINNQGKDLLQIGAAFLVQVGSDLLQIGAGITYLGNYYESVHNSGKEKFDDKKNRSILILIMH